MMLSEMIKSMTAMPIHQKRYV